MGAEFHFLQDEKRSGNGLYNLVNVPNTMIVYDGVSF